jgi:hypothetical protein
VTIMFRVFVVCKSLGHYCTLVCAVFCTSLDGRRPVYVLGLKRGLMPTFVRHNFTYRVLNRPLQAARVVASPACLGPDS